MCVAKAIAGFPPNVDSVLWHRQGNIDEAFLVDIVGLYDTGKSKIGDTLTEGETMVISLESPSFSPEIFAEVVNKDAMKTKQLEKG